MFKKGMMNNLKAQAAKIKGSLENLKAEGSSGGGLVKVTVSGFGKVEELVITDEAKNEDSEILCDLIKVAINQANVSLEEKRTEIMPMGMGSLF
jgi:DNA-binding protein YbaB